MFRQLLPRCVFVVVLVLLASHPSAPIMDTFGEYFQSEREFGELRNLFAFQNKTLPLLLAASSAAFVLGCTHKQGLGTLLLSLSVLTSFGGSLISLDTHDVIYPPVSLSLSALDGCSWDHVDVEEKKNEPQAQTAYKYNRVPGTSEYRSSMICLGSWYYTS